MRHRNVLSDVLLTVNTMTHQFFEEPLDGKLYY